MAKQNYNTFVVIDCKARKVILVTSSARRASSMLRTGVKVEVWNKNERVEVIRSRDCLRESMPMAPYIMLEREYIATRQATAEARNRRRCHGS